MTKNTLQLFIGIIIVLTIYAISQLFSFRLDLTTDKRYSLSHKTEKLLKSLQNNYQAEIFLSGDLPYGFQKLQEATCSLLDEMNSLSGHNIQYAIPNINTQNADVVDSLMRRGLSYTSVNIKDKKGKMTQQLLFPSLLLHNGEKEVVINLLKNNPQLSGQENLEASIASLEYELTNGLRMLEREHLPIVAFLDGQEELSAAETIDFGRTLAENYEVKRIEAKDIDTTVAALIIAQPRADFTEDDKFAVDQYVMKGGKVLWLIDEVAISMDSLRAHSEALAMYKPTNLEDQLFTYGVRINPDLVLDMNADLLKINTALRGEKPRFSPLPFAYQPLLETNPYHVITQSVPPVRAVFANSIDTLNVEEVSSAILLRTSAATRLEKVPKVIAVRDIEHMQQAEFYPQTNTNVAVLLEGRFPSVFRGRLAYTRRTGFRDKSVDNKMIVIADGDIIRNETKGTGAQMQFLPLGYNADFKYLHGNKTFLLNAIDYLCDEEGWLQLRSKEYRPAMLSKAKARKERTYWQWLNVAVPLVLLCFFALAFNLFRKQKYARKRE